MELKENARWRTSTKRKVKDGGRWTDRNKIAEELEKHSHPLNVKLTDLYNIVNGQNREESEDYAGHEEGCYRER